MKFFTSIASMGIAKAQGVLVTLTGAYMEFWH